MKIKVLYVTHKFPPAVGGMEKQCFELFQGIKDDYEILFLRLKNERNRVLWLLTLGFRIRRILKKNPDVTHVYFNDGLCGLGAAAVKKVSQATTIVTLHGLDVVFPNKWFQKALKRNFDNYLDHIIPVSEATGKECLSRGADKKKMTVIANGVDLDIGNVPDDGSIHETLKKLTGKDLTQKKILVSIGRSVSRKGFSWFIEEVLPLLDDEYVYCMIGPRQKKLRMYTLLFSVLPKFMANQIERMGVGTDMQRVLELQKRPEFKERAFHLGTLPHNDKINMLKHSHAFVMPNIRVKGDAEGFGLVALEAVLSGTPVIAANIEGITEAIVDGKNGALVESGNAAQWAKSIKALPAAGAKRKRLISASIEYSKDNYSWQKMVREYKKVFTKKTAIKK